MRREGNPTLPDTQAGEALIRIQAVVVRMKTANREIQAMIAPGETARSRQEPDTATVAAAAKCVTSTSPRCIFGASWITPQPQGTTP